MRNISHALDCLTVVTEDEATGVDVRHALEQARAWIAVALVAEAGASVSGGYRHE